MKRTTKNATEQYCKDQLIKYKLYEGYENEKFTLVEAFHFGNELYARTQNGRGEFTQRGNSKVLPITYTPDFVGKDFVIEVKGYIKQGSYDAFPLRFKLFKKWLTENKIGKTLYVPRNKKEIDLTIQMILLKRKNLID